MNLLISEFVTYIIKFFAMLLCMIAGVAVGIKVRKRKNEKLAAENDNE